MIKFTITGRLPGLNEYTKTNRANKYGGNSLKKKTEQFIIDCYREQLKELQITSQVEITYTWYEPNKRRDKDNIASAKKFINDALVKCGALKNDGWKQVSGFTDRFEVDKENPRVEVLIKLLGVE